MSKFLDTLQPINCSGKLFHVSSEILSKLPWFKDELAKWNPRDPINLCRDEKFFAAMIKYLQGYPLNGKEFSMAQHELAFFGHEISIDQLTINEDSEDFSFVADSLNENGNRICKEFMTVKKEIFQILPELRAALTATTARQDGRPHIQVPARVLLALTNLQLSMAGGDSLQLACWHHLHKWYSAKPWNKVALLEANLCDDAKAHHGSGGVFDKKVKLSWYTLKDGSIDIWCFEKVILNLDEDDTMSDLLKSRKEEEFFKFWKLVDQKDETLLDQPEGSCFVAYTCYEKEDLEED